MPAKLNKIIFVVHCVLTLMMLVCTIQLAIIAIGVTVSMASLHVLLQSMFRLLLTFPFSNDYSDPTELDFFLSSHYCIESIKELF